MVKVRSPILRQVQVVAHLGISDLELGEHRTRGLHPPRTTAE